jgi:hypothetical protein
VRFAVPLVFDDNLGGFGENLLALGRSYGLTDSQAGEILAEALAATAEYLDRVAALEEVPAERRQRLIETVGRERDLLESTLRAASTGRPRPRTG